MKKYLVLWGGCLALWGVISFSQYQAEESAIDTIGHTNMINAAIGERAFLETFGVLPTAETDADLRIRTHLAYVERELRQRDVTYLPADQQAARQQSLNELRHYWQNEQFPRNEAYPGTHRPCRHKDGWQVPE